MAILLSWLIHGFVFSGFFIVTLKAIPSARNCTSISCHHGGACVDNITSGVKCICVAGYTGERCEIGINECQSNPCKNNSTCVDYINQFKCICPRGLTGKTCEVDQNECDSSPCKNGATCTDGFNMFTCTCASGFTGSFCEKRMQGKCGDPPSIPNGSVKTVKSLGMYVYSCNTGYKVIGSRLVTCKNGRWTGRPPTCQLPATPKLSCGRPKRIRHGEVEPNDRDRFTVGSTVRYVCKDRYRLRGNAQLTCGHNGKWQPGKLPRCTRKTKCRDPGTPEHGSRVGSLFFEGTQVRFSCDDGYELVGESTLKCILLCQSCSSVRWNDVTPECMKIDPLRGLQRVAESLRQHFIDKLSWTTSDSLARAGLSSGAGGLDLVFVFDSSASVGKANFQKGIAFAKTIIDEFGISNSTSGTRVAVVTFSSTAEVIFNLKKNAMPNKAEAIKVLENMDFIAGGTATRVALNKTIEEIVPQTRNNSKKALFLITDGRSNIGGDPSQDASLLRALKFEIYAIGVTNSVDEQELRSIASEPFRTHVHLLEKFEDLTKLKELITTKGSDYSECGVAGDTQLRNDEMVLGDSEAKPGAWPWIAAVYVKGKFRCGGVLIKEKLVLTVAQCFLFDGKVEPRDVIVRLGEHDRTTEEGTEQNIGAKNLIIHPNATIASLRDDLALVRLKNAVKFSPYVRTVCLPQPSDVFYVRSGKHCLIAGWGSSQEVPSDNLAGAPLRVLQQEQIQFASHRDCRENASDPAAITDKVVCAGDPTGDRDACKSDRGSPLVVRRLDDLDSWVVVGLSSWRQGCATQGDYGVYTRVDSYIRWINRKVNKKKKKKKD